MASVITSVFQAFTQSRSKFLVITVDYHPLTMRYNSIIVEHILKEA